MSILRPMYALCALAVPFTLASAAAVTPSNAAGHPSVTRVAKADTAVFAGGCFWGVEAVFEHVRGVIDVVSGYSGGSANTAEYETVSGGNTGHAESVRVVYDPSKVTYSDLLQIFFSVAHDPTQLNRQGPDAGTQYRSAIFFMSPEQERTAKAYVAQMERAKTFANPIVTQITAFKAFYPAEAYHQDFAERHPDHPYILAYDREKVERLHKLFPAMYQEREHGK